MCHIAQSCSKSTFNLCHGKKFINCTVLIGSMQHGACTIKPSKIGFSSEELVDMIARCSLNRLHQFASFLGLHIRHARQNPKLLAHLKALDTIMYSGLPLPSEEEEFANQTGLNIIVRIEHFTLIKSLILFLVEFVW